MLSFLILYSLFACCQDNIDQAGSDTCRFAGSSQFPKGEVTVPITGLSLYSQFPDLFVKSGSMSGWHIPNSNTSDAISSLSQTIDSFCEKYSLTGSQDCTVCDFIVSGPVVKAKNSDGDLAMDENDKQIYVYETMKFVFIVPKIQEQAEDE